MEAKYVIFSLCAVLGVPLGIFACAFLPALTRWVMVLMVWATCEPMAVGINFVSREFYRANTRGFEVTLADLCALILAGYMILKRKEKPIRWFPPMALVTLLYLLVGFVSWTLTGPPIPVPEEAAVRVPYAQFEVGLYPLFELCKIARGYLMFWVILNYVRDEKTAKDLLWGMGATVLYMGYLALSSRYLYGVNRVKATLGHPNTLATYMAMLGSFCFAFVLYFRSAALSMFWGGLTMLSAVGVVLTISRGGLAALVVGIWVNTMVLLPRHLNVKNMALILLSALVAAAILAAALDTLMGRFVGEQNAADDLAYRGKYNAEAKLMSQDHFFGVGLGNFSAESWTKYAAIVDPDLPPGTPAHNNWFLTLGELGWPGLVALALFWARFFQLVLPFYFHGKKDLMTTLAQAGCTAIIVNHIQSMLQLGYRQTPLFFMTMTFMGLGLAAWYAKREQSLQAPQAALAVGGGYA